MLELVLNLDGPPLHDSEEVKGGLDEHGPSLQITLLEVHKGLLHHPTGLVAERETALDSSNAMEGIRLIAQSSGSWESSSNGLLQSIKRRRTYLTSALLATLRATLQSSNARCSSCGDCPMAGFLYLCIRWGLHYRIFSHVWFLSGHIRPTRER